MVPIASSVCSITFGELFCLFSCLLTAQTAQVAGNRSLHGGVSANTMYANSSLQCHSAAHDERSLTPNRIQDSECQCSDRLLYTTATATRSVEQLVEGRSATYPQTQPPLEHDITAPAPPQSSSLLSWSPCSLSSSRPLAATQSLIPGSLHFCRNTDQASPGTRPICSDRGSAIPVRPSPASKNIP